MDGGLAKLSIQIQQLLQQRPQDDPILQCGEAVLCLVWHRPDDVLALAHSKLNTWPYVEVPVCWRRLFEDASLAKVARRIDEALPDTRFDSDRVKRPRLDTNTRCSPDLITDLVEILDRGLIMSGAPLRSSTFAAAFQQLDQESNAASCVSDLQFLISEPNPLSSNRSIARASHRLSLESFQRHLDTAFTPLVILKAISDWPAVTKWCQPHYLFRMTLGGRRLVPVELGRSYTDDDWGQKFMSFREFLKEYVLEDHAADRTGYLAQHDLFAQIPQLRNDIMTPDYCYATPPSKNSLRRDAAGLQPADSIDEPLMNAWFGPKGTTTPLHTDPYHNILCQAVGYKYLRLYSPQETNKLYPRGSDEKGINMENTSQVDVSFCSYASRDDGKACSEKRHSTSQFPLFAQAEYQEAIIGPGDALYIPSGWWHYVESLSPSFSVSFWWN